MTFARELADEVKARGSITAAEYMMRCNAHYYGTRDPFGAEGDFTTAPEISQIFGELMGAWTANAWQNAGAVRALVLEPGPGRGTLMKDALRASRKVSGFHDAIDICMVETSPVLTALQKRTLKDSHPRIRWQETLDDLPALPLFVIANEFFDALPVTQFVAQGPVTSERQVAHDGDRFFFIPEGRVVAETSFAARKIMRHIAQHIALHGGAALIIDYGYHEGAQCDTLQAVRRHAFASPLHAPGEADITAHVDFAALAAEARLAGATPHGPVTQGTFLKRLGAELRAAALCKAATPVQQTAILCGLERLVAPHRMGELFKVMAVTPAPEVPAGFG